MRQAIITAILALVAVVGQAQDVPEAFRPMIDRLSAFGKTIPQEKVYVHMDNTCYFQGDTIWFTAYTRQTNTDTPSDMSSVLYMELLNNDGYLVERKLIEMKKGRGRGFFDLNNLIQYSGFYELRAYTRWQLNWGEHEHKHPYFYGFMFRDKESEREYFRDYDKLYSRVFPVYDKPLAPGDYTRDMTLRVMRREFKNDPDKRKLQLSLFPEGGNLIAGVENRVAFEAAMSDGEQVDGFLTIGDEQAKTVNRGRGMFTFVPTKGQERKVTFTSADGEMVSAMLPQPEEVGVSIKVVQAGDNIIIETSLAGLSADSLALTIMHEGKVEEFHEFKSKFKVQSPKLKAGIHQVTVFDIRGRVWADRLFFVTKPEMREPTIIVEGTKEEYRPYEKVEMKIKAEPPSKGRTKGSLPTQGEDWSGSVSLAVRDGYQTDLLFDNGNIMTEMLLSSEIKGFIPNPGWFFEKDDEEHRQALDLLMMTQGWRRFAWRDMAVKGEWELTQPVEKYPLLMGKVSFNPNRISFEGIKDLKDTTGSIPRRDYKYAVELAKKKLTPSLRVHSELVHLDTNESAVSEEHYTGDYFKMPCPKFYGNCVFFLSVADTAKWEKRDKEYAWIQMAGYGEEYPLRIMRKLDLDEADYRAYISWPYPRFVKPYNFYQTHLLPNFTASGYSIPSELLADSTKALREVTIKVKRKSRLKGFNAAYPAFMVDAYEAWNMIEDAGVPIFDYRDIRKAMVRVYLNDYGVNEERDGNRDERIRFSMPRQSLAEYINVPVDSLDFPTILQTPQEGEPVPQASPSVDLEGDKNLSSGEASSTVWGEVGAIPEESSNISPGERRNYFGDERINEDPRFVVEKYVVYTDYQPRLEGSSRYMGANRPTTVIATYPYPDGRKRAVYRDRRYILDGFAYPAAFYNPDYSVQTPPEPTDYRRTLYWNPDLKLDANGEASISFYNNSRQTTLSVEAEGQAADGTLLWSKHSTP